MTIVLTIYHLKKENLFVNNYPDLACGDYKSKIRKWLKSCIETYKKEYCEQ